MTRKELHQQVADRTGESIETVESLGFSLLQRTLTIEERAEPLVIDWDLEQETRYQRGAI